MAGHDPLKEELDALMAEEGVVPLARTRRQATPRPRVVPTVATPPAAEVALRGELTRVRASQDASATALASVKAELSAVQDALRRQVEGRERVERALKRLQRERVAVPETPVATLEQVLRRRGLEDGERVTALTALAEFEGAGLLEALSSGVPGVLEAFVDDRLGLRCADPRCTSVGTASVEVPPARCEVCGGTELRHAFRAFVEACAKADIRRVVIVGGSPMYRRELRPLAEGVRRELRIDLIQGRGKPREKQVRGHARNADRVLLWCSSIIDHATTNAFVASGANCLHIPHRGIATMLYDAATRL